MWQNCPLSVPLGTFQRPWELPVGWSHSVGMARAVFAAGRGRNELGISKWLMSHYRPEQELNWNSFSHCRAPSERSAGSAPWLRGDVGSFVLGGDNTSLCIVWAAED